MSLSYQCISTTKTVNNEPSKILHTLSCLIHPNNHSNNVEHNTHLLYRDLLFLHCCATRFNASSHLSNTINKYPQQKWKTRSVYIHFFAPILPSFHSFHVYFFLVHSRIQTWEYIGWISGMTVKTAVCWNRIQNMTKKKHTTQKYTQLYRMQFVNKLDIM